MDKQLLEAAAKAAGLEIGFTPAHPNGRHGCYFSEGGEAIGWWNPLDDDGDAFRLAVDLNFAVEVARESGGVYVGGGSASVTESVPEGATDAAWREATRLAIVRAAAAVAGVGSFSAA